ncbi:hypothetical protein C8R44DRAFT_890582 [Mycena epipterygia]|nr:hypothetical protein C8R44DRAFT_890582 [Mycena epipterygia]
MSIPPVWRIRNIGQGGVLDLTSAGALISYGSWHGGTNQQWVVAARYNSTPSGPALYSIRSQEFQNRYVTFTIAHGTTAGAPVEARDIVSIPNIEVRVHPSVPGAVTLNFQSAPHLVFDLGASGTTVRSIVLRSLDISNPNMMWVIDRTGQQAWSVSYGHVAPGRIAAAEGAEDHVESREGDEYQFVLREPFIAPVPSPESEQTGQL